MHNKSLIAAYFCRFKRRNTVLSQKTRYIEDAVDWNFSVTMRHTLLLYFFLCTYGFARAEVSAPILALPSPTEAVQPCLRVLTDVPENTGFDSVRNIPVNEYSVFQDVIPQLKRNKSYWLRLQVRNTEAETKTYYLIAGITQEIDLYVSGTDGTYTKKSYGYSVPDNRKEYSDLYRK